MIGTLTLRRVSETAFPIRKKHHHRHAAAAGGGSDLIYRAPRPGDGNVGNINFLVTNITGAGSANGTNEVLNHEADGYGLGAGTHHCSNDAGLDPGIPPSWTTSRPLTGIRSFWRCETTSPGNLRRSDQRCPKPPRSNHSWKRRNGRCHRSRSVRMNIAFDRSFNVTPFNGGADLM